MNMFVDKYFLLDENIQRYKRNRINKPWITSSIIASIGLVLVENIFSIITGLTILKN